MLKVFLGTFVGGLVAAVTATAVQGKLFESRLRDGLADGSVKRYTDGIAVSETDVMISFYTSSKMLPLYSLVIPEAILPAGRLETTYVYAGEVLRRHLKLGWSDECIISVAGMDLSKAAVKEATTPAEAEAPAKDWKPFGEDGPIVMDIKGTPHGSGPAMA